MKTFLNYIGSKRRLLKKIERFLPNSINNYYEPFVGGGSMLFHLNRFEAHHFGKMNFKAFTEFPSS